jgi:hypothetical protein
MVLYLGEIILFSKQSLQGAHRAQTSSFYFWLVMELKMSTEAQSFFLLLLHDKLNTRERLRRRHMHLDSYMCENCILQKVESAYHLFLRCNFANNYWSSIGVTPPRIHCPQRAVTSINKQLHVLGAFEIVILMTWSI